MQQLIIYGRPQDLTLLFKIPIGTRKDFFKIYRKFGQGALRNVRQPWAVLW